MNWPKRGDIYWVSLDPTIGSEMKKRRPAVIISNDISNQFSHRVIIAPITSSIKKIFPFEVPVEIASRKGKIALDQIRSVDKKRLGKQLGMCEPETIVQINITLKFVLELR